MTNLTRGLAWLIAPAMFLTLAVTQSTLYLMGDFRAFYCGGAAIAAHANPYLQEPLHSCEVGLARVPLQMRSITLPAPLPPFALAAFGPLSRLPFDRAAIVFSLLSVAASAFAIVLFARVTGMSTGLLNIAFAAIVATQIWYIGQPMSFVLAALAAAAVLLRAGRMVGASACALIACAEPHIALPVLVAMLIMVAKSRIPVILFGGVLGAVSIVAVGLATSIAYVREVLPAHALANAYEWQTSLTSILTSTGMAAPAAVRWGEAMYAVMVVVGVVVACRLCHLSGDRAALVLIPPAFAVFGGVHIHLAQIVIALPTFAYICMRYPIVRNVTGVGMTFTMIPWNVLSASVMTGFTPFLVGIFGRAMLGARRGLILTLVAAAIALSVLVLAVKGLETPTVTFVGKAYPPNALAEASWAPFSHAVLGHYSVLMQLLRIPTLVGLALGLTGTVMAAFGRASVGARQPTGSVIYGANRTL